MLFGYEENKSLVPFIRHVQPNDLKMSNEIHNGFDMSTTLNKYVFCFAFVFSSILRAITIHFFSLLPVISKWHTSCCYRLSVNWIRAFWARQIGVIFTISAKLIIIIKALYFAILCLMCLCVETKWTKTEEKNQKKNRIEHLKLIIRNYEDVRCDKAKIKHHHKHSYTLKNDLKMKRECQKRRETSQNRVYVLTQTKRLRCSNKLKKLFFFPQKRIE